jgi:hypothetical protein
MSDAERFVVEVRENVTEALIEHEGRVYLSPPQDREQALELVALLLGRPAFGNGGAEQLWRQAIAGGQRSVKLRRIPLGTALRLGIVVRERGFCSIRLTSVVCGSREGS